MRTLALLLELLIAVVSYQYLSVARVHTMDAVWLAGDCGVAAQGPSSPPHNLVD